MQTGPNLKHQQTDTAMYLKCTFIFHTVENIAKEKMVTTFIKGGPSDLETKILQNN